MTAGPVPCALTIAGSDSGGGAGIQADLKTFAAFGVYGMSVITSLTAQNTQGVAAIHDVPPDFVARQLDAVLSDIGADAVKTGMLSNARIVEVVADRLWKFGVSNLVVDPLMQAKGGRSLLAREGQEALTRLLLPLALVVTPNLPEAEALAGRPVATPDEMKDAARAIAARGVRNVLIKGGHRLGPGPVVDLLFDGRDFHEFAAERIPAKNTHGTGCVFSAAIAAGLARGQPLLESVRRAKAFVTRAIRHAHAIGHGRGPINPLWPFVPPELE